MSFKTVKSFSIVDCTSSPNHSFYLFIVFFQAHVSVNIGIKTVFSLKFDLLKPANIRSLLQSTVNWTKITFFGKILFLLWFLLNSRQLECFFPKFSKCPFLTFAGQQRWIQIDLLLTHSLTLKAWVTRVS